MYVAKSFMVTLYSRIANFYKKNCDSHAGFILALALTVTVELD